MSVHTCFFYNDEGNRNNTKFRLLVGVFKQMGGNYLLNQDEWIKIDVKRCNSSETQGCESKNLTVQVPVREGDRIAVQVKKKCKKRCPLQPNLNAPGSTPVFFTRSNVESIPVSQVMATEHNVYLDVSTSIGKLIVGSRRNM